MKKRVGFINGRSIVYGGGDNSKNELKNNEVLLSSIISNNSNSEDTSNDKYIEAYNRFYEIYASGNHGKGDQHRIMTQEDFDFFEQFYRGSYLKYVQNTNGVVPKDVSFNFVYSFCPLKEVPILPVIEESDDLNLYPTGKLVRTIVLRGLCVRYDFILYVYQEQGGKQRFYIPSDISFIDILNPIITHK